MNKRLNDCVKVYIRGVKGRSKEVIESLKSLGGKCSYNINGGLAENIYYIDSFGEICAVNLHSGAATAIIWAGTEIFLEELKEESTVENTSIFTNTLKENYPVICSDNGIDWFMFRYCKGDMAYYLQVGRKDTKKCKYIVPYFSFDFNDIESNIKRSII